jgi:hypothetical protein
MSAPVPAKAPVIRSRISGSAEPFVYYLFIGLYLIPVFLGSHTLTNDGPAHLYNATLLKHFWDNQADFTSHYFELNTHISTNWVGHGLLAILMYVVPDWAAEKIILCIYLIGMPLSFRYALRQLKPENSVYSLLIFPFLYCQVFTLGFYSQFLSFVALFALLGKWLAVDYRFTLPNTLTLTGLVMLVAFCHMLTFLVSLLVLGSFLLDHFTRWPEGRFPRLSFSKAFWQAAGRLLFICLPAIFGFLYFITHSKGTEKIYFPQEQLAYLKGLLTLTMVLDSDGTWMTRLLFAALLLSLTTLSMRALRHLVNQRLYTYRVAFGIIGTGLLLLYLGMPERIAGGFIIRPRLGFLLFAFLILLLATYTAPATKRKVWWLSILLTTGFCLHQIYYFYRIHILTDEILTARRFIPNRSVVLPYTAIEYTTRIPETGPLSYPFIHISNDLCLGKESVCLHNYQAQYDYFPICGKHWSFGTKSILDGLHPAVKPSVTDFEYLLHGRITHVVLIGTTEDNPMLAGGRVKAELSRHFHLAYTSPHHLVTVYERN